MTTLELAEAATQHVAREGEIAAAVFAGGEGDKGIVSVPLYRARRGHGVGLTSAAPVPAPPPKPTVIARTLALAHRLQAMLDDGRAQNRAELARKLGFSRARVTQIMNLLYLAPDIQEEILFSVSPAGSAVVTARDVKTITRVMDWAEQRRLWREVRDARRDRDLPGAQHPRELASPLDDFVTAPRR